MNSRNQCIDKVAMKLSQVIKSVINSNIEVTTERKIAEDLGNYIPTPFEIAQLYGVRYKFIKISGEMPSYMSQGLGTIYISDRYLPNSYEAKYLCAHELGHFFMQDGSEMVAMNNDELNEYLPLEIMKEYEANVFAILLMPQFMSGEPWENYSPQTLNTIVYQKVFKSDG